MVEGGGANRADVGLSWVPLAILNPPMTVTPLAPRSIHDAILTATRVARAI